MCGPRAVLSRAAADAAQGCRPNPDPDVASAARPAQGVRLSVSHRLRKVDMKFAIAACAVMLATAFATDTLQAQGTVQSITASRVDVVQLASGYRASKAIGSTVYNDGRDTIRTIVDLIVNPRDSARYAILSLGGFSVLVLTWSRCRLPVCASSISSCTYRAPPGTPRRRCLNSGYTSP
jgi:hypothetical protein